MEKGKYMQSDLVRKVQKAETVLIEIFTHIGTEKDSNWRSLRT